MSSTVLICSECGTGNYIEPGIDSSLWECDHCGHEIAAADVVLDEGESLTMAGGLLSVVHAEES